MPFVRAILSRNNRGDRGAEVIKGGIHVDETIIPQSASSHEPMTQKNRLKTNQHFTLMINKINQLKETENQDFPDLQVTTRGFMKNREVNVTRCS